MVEKFLAEVLGTGALILLGDGVVAGVLLAKSKAQNSGWIVITCGLGHGRDGRRPDRRSPISGAHLNPAVTLGAGRSTVRIPWDEVPMYCAGELLGAFIGAVLVYLALLPALGGDRGRRPQARRLLHRPGHPQPGLEPRHRDHRHVRPGVRHPRLRHRRHRASATAALGVLLVGVAGARHRPVARRPDRVRDQPGPRPRAAHRALPPADPRQGRLRLGATPGSRSSGPLIGGAPRRHLSTTAFTDSAPAMAVQGERRRAHGEVRRSDRPGHDQHPLHDLRPRGQVVAVDQKEHEQIFPQARLGRARPGGDLGAHARR